MPDAITSHVVEYTVSGATCSCGKTWSVWNTTRKAGWQAAHDADRTRNLLRASANRHAKAQTAAAKRSH